MIVKTTSQHKSTHKKINIAMVSDFYKPHVGGVEMHIERIAASLSQNQKIGKVIIITHKYEKLGDKYIGVLEQNGIRVYYLNLFYNRTNMVIMPSFLFDFFEAKRILEYENIDIVHCHQSSSTLALEFIVYCKLLGIRVILTEHSLLGFRVYIHIIYNKFSQIFLKKCYRIIAVSQTAKRNLILRCHLPPHRISVIANGVSNEDFRKKQRSDSEIRIICAGRVAHRRGADILIGALPGLCALDQRIRIWIVGDGDKIPPLKARILLCKLQNQVKILGVKPHQQLLKLLTQCDIFLNAPLTESFGIGLAQAVQVGLFCISTDVGAIKQSIPNSFLHLVDLNAKSLVNGVAKRVQQLKQEKEIQNLNNQNFEYKWENVIDRTVQVYEQTMKEKPYKRLRKEDLKLNLKDLNFLVLFLLLMLVAFIGNLLEGKDKDKKIPKTFKKGLQ